MLSKKIRHLILRILIPGRCRHSTLAFGYFARWEDLTKMIVSQNKNPAKSLNGFGNKLATSNSKIRVQARIVSRGTW
jgi:hypothetical protein